MQSKFKEPGIINTIPHDRPEEKGVLILVPTPLDPNAPLEPVALEMLKKAVSSQQELDKTVFVCEEFRAICRRWTRWGLPREVLELFVPCHVQNAEATSRELLKQLQNGKKVFIMSDGGMPAFCDPGQYLVNLCHQNHIQVTSTPFPNAIALSVALSGFPHERFVFEGFLRHPNGPSETRGNEIRRILREKAMVVLMDTPYRLRRLVADFRQEMVRESCTEREVFLAMDLNTDQEELMRGKVSDVEKKLALKGEKQKREFIFILEGLR